MNMQDRPKHRRTATTARSDRKRIGGLAVALVVLATTFGVVHYRRATRNADVLLAQGHKAYEQRDFRQANKLARHVLDGEPDRAEANLLAARSAAAVGEFSTALAYFSKIPDNHSTAAIAARCEAGDVVLLHFKRLSEAESLFRRALQQDPRDLTANDHLAFSLGLASRNWELIPYRLMLIELDRVEPLHLYLLTLGDSAIENDNLISDYHRQEPADPAPLLALCRLAFEAQDYARAKELAQAAAQRNPNLVEAYVKLGRILVHNRDEAGLKAWQNGLPAEAEHHPGTWTTRAAWMQLNALDPMALRCYWETLRRDANHQGANYQLGRQLAALGRSGDAEPFLERAKLLQEYTNAVKFAVQQSRADGAQAAAALAERLGLMWEAYGWHRLAHRFDPGMSSSGRKSQEIRARFFGANPPQTRNIASANPALEIDLSEFPLPEAIGGGAPLAPPARLATAPPTFEDQASQAGLEFRYFNGGDPTRDIRRMYEFTGGGVGVLDFDGDGWPDLYFTQGSAWPPGPDRRAHQDRLFRNLGNGQFRDVTQLAGVVEGGFSQGVSVGDYDNDGFADVYVANIGANRLFRNNGDGTFADVPVQIEGDARRWTTSCLLADVNGDGLPDRYDVNYLTGHNVFTLACEKGVCMPQQFPAAQDQLFLNRGDGSFADVTSTSGIEIPNGKGLGIVAADYDGDGAIELFVANDSEANFFFCPEHRRGDAPQFVDRALSNGLALNEEGRAEACMGVAVADADADGRLDLYVTNFYQESNTLYLQEMAGIFRDATHAARLRDPSMYVLGFGTQFLDAELDGWPDLFVANGHIDDFRDEGSPYQMPPQFYRNRGDTTFDYVEQRELGAYFQGLYLGRAAVTLDWNKDGKQDLLVGHLDAPVALLTNTTRSVGNYLAVHLRGTESVRDAIGASVHVGVAGRFRVGQLTAGDGYQASNERRLVFGLGDGRQVETLSVRWPSGKEQTFTNLPGNRELMLVEGRAAPLLVSPHGSQMTIDE